jgi:hypothetical protein
MLGKIARQSNDSRLRDVLKPAVSEVEPEEDEHLNWAKRADGALGVCSYFRATKELMKIGNVRIPAGEYGRGMSCDDRPASSARHSLRRAYQALAAVGPSSFLAEFITREILSRLYSPQVIGAYLGGLSALPQLGRHSTTAS